MSYQQFRPTSYKLLPEVIKNLLIINFILWFAHEVLSDKLGLDLNMKFGLYFPGSENFNPIQYVTHLFLHGGFLHIASNMFALWMFGSALENVWGGKRFLIFYAVTGIGAAFIHTLFTWYDISQLQQTVDIYAANPGMIDFIALIKQNIMYMTQDSLDGINKLINEWDANPDSYALADRSVVYAQEIVTNKMNIPTVGASGAVFGVLLAFGMLFPNTVLYLYFAIPIKAKYFVIMYGLFELYNGIANNPGDNVAHFAHLGGMLFAFILIKYWNKNNRNQFY
jgi:rhomboid family protein